MCGLPSKFSILMPGRVSRNVNVSDKDNVLTLLWLEEENGFIVAARFGMLHCFVICGGERELFLGYAFGGNLQRFLLFITSQ